MDKWLGLKSTTRTQKKSSSSKKQKQKEKQAKQQTLPQNQDQDLQQLALEESRLASDIEKAIALSLSDAREKSSSHHEQPPPKTTPPLRFTVSSSSPYSSAKRSKSKSSSAVTSTTTHRPPSSSHTTAAAAVAAAFTSSSSSGTWAVETFVNELLNPPSAEILHDDNTVSDDDISLDTDFDFDDESTIESDSQQSVKNPATAATPPPVPLPPRATTKPDNNNNNQYHDDSDWEITYNSDTEVPLGSPPLAAATTTNPDDYSDWEITYDPDTEAHSPDTHNDFHDAQAESNFFGQLRRETWDKDELRTTHNAMKKRSMATAVIKSKETRRTNSSHASSTGETHDYYTTADDVLEGAFEAAGFGDSAAGLSWEGVGQSRYA